MDELIQLLREHGAADDVIALAERLAAATVPEVDPESTDPAARLLVWPEGTEPLTDEELGTLRDYLVALADDDSAPVDLLNEALNAADRIANEDEARQEVAEADAAQREDLRRRLRGETDDAEGEGEDPDGDDGDGDDPDGDEGETEGEGDPAGDGEREPVLAAGRRVPRSMLSGRRPRQTAARTPDEDSGESGPPVMSEIVWAHDVPDVRGGSTASDLRQVDRALERRRASFRHSRPRDDGAVDYIRVATVKARFPESRRLVDNDGQALAPTEVSRRIEAALSEGIEAARANGGMFIQPQGPNGMVAAGGLCTLPTPLYNVVTYGDTRRPIRDQALVSFLAARGGVTDLTPPTLPNILIGDAAGNAIRQWTVANDEAAVGGTPTKPCQRIVCGAQRTTQIYAVTFCLTVGNFLARTYSELQNAWTSLGAVAHARFSEALLFARLQTLATTVNNATTEVSATRDVFAVLDQAAAGLRSRHRLSVDFPLTVILPEVLQTVARIDISRQMPTGTLADTMALAQAEINRWFQVRAINPVWSPDVNVMGAQGPNTPLAALPPVINYVMYPAGTFIHLDGGDLDLGVVRDTTTNAVNDFQIFNETFENVHMVGPEAIDGTIAVCPSGAVNGTLDPAPLCASYT